MLIIVFRMDNKRFQYTPEDLKNAIDAIISQTLSYRQAAQHYKVPKGTLETHVKNKCARKGKLTVLTSLEEDMIVNWLLNASDRGFPATKTQLMNSVQMFLNRELRTTVFKNNKPGRDWYGRFMGRHPELSLRISQNLSKSRSILSEAAIRSWFGQVSSKFTRFQ
jgi:hypothetical protein